MRNRHQKGFTLIELLIVIAIIGILAAVLIPNLLQARARANNAVAQTCATGLSTAAEIYNVDNNTYVGFTGGFAIENGANSCTNAQLAVTLGTPTVDNYSFTVGHTAGTGVYTVTPNGLTGPVAPAPTAAAPLTAPL
jgi:type IV pilus assembly protein PilA